jgi:hypothetical protein
LYKTKIAIPPDLFRAVRDLRPRTRRNFNRELERAVRPALQKTVTRLLGVDPGAVHIPFEFATDRSRRFYFARFKGRIPYQRTGVILAGWLVEIPRSGEKSYIVVYNKVPAAQYVYGTPFQRQVPGHARTGWGRNNKAAFTAIQREAFDLIADAWYAAVTGALEGR